MKLQIFDNAEKNSREIKEFKSFLQYSLHFDYDISDLKDEYTDISYIDTIFKKCHSICSYLFHIDGAYSFFGSSAFSKDTQYPDLCFSPTFWTSSIKYHCIISSLHTLLYSLLNNQSISSYKFYCHAQGLGYFSLKQNNLLTLNNNQVHFNNYISTNNSSIASDTNSNFIRTYNTFYNKLSDNEKKILRYHSNSNTFSLFNSDLNYRLYKARKELNHYRNFSLASSEKPLTVFYQQFLSSTKELEEILYKSSSTSNIDIVDSILLQYKAERYYNFSLIHYIIDNLLIFSNENSNFSIDSIPCEILSTCFCLPNVFSRKAFFKFALHSFKNDYLENSIFFKRHQDTGPVGFSRNPTLEGNRLLTWLDLFRKYNLFFSHIIFPIYEKCFFILLQDSLTQDQKDHNIFLIQAIELLHQYILSHSDDITEYKDQKPSVRNLLMTDEPNTTGTYEISLLDKKAAALLAQKLLLSQNNIIHPSSPIRLSSSGFHPGNTYHRQLMTLTVDSILNSI